MAKNTKWKAFIVPVVMHQRRLMLWRTYKWDPISWICPCIWFLILSSLVPAGNTTPPKISYALPRSHHILHNGWVDASSCSLCSVGRCAAKENKKREDCVYSCLAYPYFMYMCIYLCAFASTHHLVGFAYLLTRACPHLRHSANCSPFQFCMQY